MQDSETKVARILLELGLVTEGLLKKAEQEQKKKEHRLTESLLALGVNAEFIRQALAARLKLPEAPLQGRKIEPEVLGLIPENWVQKHGIIPLEITGNTLTLGMTNPLNLEIVKDIRFKTGLNIRVAVISEAELPGMIQVCYGVRAQQPEFNLDQILDNISTPQVEVLAQGYKEEETEEEFPENIESEGPIIRLVDRIIQDAVRARATDIHIEPARANVNVRYRIDGVLRDVLQVPKYIQGPTISRIKVMGSMDITEKRKPQDGRSKIKVGEKIVDLRISSLPTMYGEKIVLRLLEQEKSVISLSELGFSPHVFRAINELLDKPQGMILVTGPTGSGKTTTLYSALSRLNNGTTNIVTVEDPVEYQVPGVNQVQINVRAGMTFASGLRSILRQDPDIILVGEIRDHETAEIAFHAAQTGHLVLSTVHTNDAASAVTRLLAIEVEPYLIASSILGIMSQRLVRKLCPKCKVPTEPSERLAQWLPKAEKNSFQIYARKGCEECWDTGFWGRYPIAEILVNNDAVRNLILAGKSDREILNAARKAGMRTIFEDGLDKVLQGLTTYEEVTRVVPPPQVSEPEEQAPPEAEEKNVAFTVAEKSARYKKTPRPFRG